MVETITDEDPLGLGVTPDPVGSLEGIPQEYAPDFAAGVGFSDGSEFEALIAEFAGIKDEKDDHKVGTSALKKREDYIEGLILRKLGEEGLEKCSALRGTASRKTDNFPNIVDWPAALKWLIEYGHTELLKKSIASAAARALVESGVDIPGVTWFEKTTLNFRRKNK